MDNQTTISSFVELKDLDIDPYRVIGYGKFTLPATMQTPEMYALTIYAHGVQAPITITYDNITERDNDFILLRTQVDGR